MTGFVKHPSHRFRAIEFGTYYELLLRILFICIISLQNTAGWSIVIWQTYLQPHIQSCMFIAPRTPF